MFNRVFAQNAPAARDISGRSSQAPRPEASPRAPAQRPRDRQPNLPDEIAFLAGHGVPLATLLEAGERARRLGVCPAAALLTGALISDHVYYSLLARRLGAPFVAAPPALSGLPARELRAGAPIARLEAGDRYLIAPEGEALRQLLALWREGRAPTARLAITTPRRLSAWTRAAGARAVARAACEDLRRADPALSAATPAPAWMRVAAVAAAVMCAAALAGGGHAWVAVCGLAGLLGAAAVGVRIYAAALSFDERGARPPVLADGHLPLYTIIVPMYREAGVVAKLATAIDALDYPAAKIDVKLVIEEDDAATRAAIEELCLPARYETIIAPPGGPRTKPRALNIALARAKGALVVVFDAEDAPERDQLRLAAERFAVANERLACLQARLAIDNSGDGWLTALFAIEYAALFDVLNPGLAAIGAPMMLGGTSNHFRAAALRRLRGWDAWNVTEDADLGLRLARFGYRVETIAASTHEEAPARIKAWVPQRRRWIKGWMQTLVVHCRDPRRVWRELGPGQSIAALALLLSGVLGPLLAPVYVGLFIHDAVWGDLFNPQTIGAWAASTLWISLAVFGAGAILLLSGLGIQRRGLRAEAKWLLALPAYYALLSYAAWGALFDFWRDPHG